MSDEENLPKQLRKLSDYMRIIAILLKGLGTKESIERGCELTEAADIAVEWSYEVEKIVNRK